MKTQMYISRTIDEQNMGYLYSRILLGNKKEQTIDICNDMDESQTNYTKVKKPEEKEYILNESIFAKLWRMQMNL